MKYSFFDIEPEGAHPEILAYMLQHNLDHFVDPEQDTFARLGAERIKKAFDIPQAAIHYVPNGTVANVIGLSSMLAPFEGVICPDSGHINTYEAGAFEATGHKIISVAAPDGKLNAQLIDLALEHYKGYHTVVPRVVYLTQVTEQGTVYTKDELVAVISHAKSKDLYVYLDGSRLAMAMASKSAGITLPEFGALDIDMFYIGGTKNGGVYGEAVVIRNDMFKPNFQNHMKRRGGDMGKQRFMSLQFARFFDEDNLWLDLATHANVMAQKLRQELLAVGAELAHDSDANHVFVNLKNKTVEELEKDYDLPRWQKIDNDTTMVRLVCGWATKNENIEEFVYTVGLQLKR